MTQEIKEREDNNDKEVFVNMPKEDMSNISDMMSDKTVLAAIAVSSVSSSLLLVSSSSSTETVVAKVTFTLFIVRPPAPPTYSLLGRNYHPIILLEKMEEFIKL